MTYPCPVCEYDGLDEPPYDETGWGSFEICPQCGTEFGYHAVYAMLNQAVTVYGFACDNLVYSPEQREALHKNLRRDWQERR